MDNIERNEAKEFEAVEQELRKCLQHVPAPEGLTQRVMERIQARDAARVQKTPHGFGHAHRHAGWWTSVAATLLLASGGGMVHLHHIRQERRAVEAQQQLDLAMQLTSHALNQVDSGLERTRAARYTQMALELSQ